MNRTKIEWVAGPNGQPGYTWNPIKGKCPVGCWYCYARRYYDRFHPLDRLGVDPNEIYLDEREIDAPFRIKAEAGIFLCSTFELFHPAADAFRDFIFGVIKDAPRHTFFILTKMPEKIDRTMPPNVWLGVSVTGPEDWGRAKNLAIHHEASVKFISFEPLLNDLSRSDLRYVAGEFDWFIIGSLTGPTRRGPRPDLLREWVSQIMEIAGDFGVPVFMKNNLRWKNTFPERLPLVQEFPEEFGISPQKGG